jgi:hypothetical protein
MITKLIDWSGHPTKGKPENLLSRYGIYAGLDVGRFVHPSHLAVIVPLEREDDEIPWKERHLCRWPVCLARRRALCQADC